MRRFRSLATRIPVLIISMLAVAALSIGGGAYASAQAAGSQAATSAVVSFHELTLVNGWQQGASIGTGDPSVALQNGIVYLKGWLAQPNPGGSQFALLPPAYRPVDMLEIPVWTSDDNFGALEIRPDGRMFLGSNTPCGAFNTAECLTSLAGVSYPLGS